MAKKQEINPKDGKRFVRDVLEATQGQGATEEVIIENVNKLGSPAVADQSRVRSWIEWNQGRGFLTYRYDDAMEEDVWFLTPRGQGEQNKTLK